MKMLPPSTGSKEHRLLALRETPLGAFADQWKNDYIKLPKEKLNPIDVSTHALGAAASGIFELTDAALETLARKIDGGKRPLEPLNGYAARSRRDIGAILGDVVSLKPLSLVTDALRLPGSIVMDGVDAAIGNDHRRN